jgi:hypothetical protein
MVRIEDILIRTRKQYFTGRAKEIEEFGHLLSGNELLANVLFVYGPPGQGKTSLLKEFTALCRLGNHPSAYLDGRDISPSTAAFYEVLFSAVRVSSLKQALAVFEKSKNRFVLFIDTYEKLQALDNWMRQEFLPQLPENVLIVLSGRNPPPSEWTSDPGWKDLMVSMQVKKLSEAESKAYLEKRKVPTEQHPTILDFTHGHPLALSLVADLIQQNPAKKFSPEDSPDVVQTLLDHFLLKSPSPAHKTALEICALTYITTESLLASVMGLEDASELFEWLKDLSFIETNKWGLYPHDLARESLIADLKWRNPDWFTHLYKKAGNYYITKLETASGEEQRKFLFKLTYLQRNHPVVRPFYNWEESHEYWVDLMKEDDLKVLSKMVLDFYGPQELKSFKYWVGHPAAQVWVWRSPDNAQSGFVMRININEVAKGEKVKDEIMQRIVDYAESDFQLRSGEVGTVFRFWMAAGTHQNVSKLQSSIFLFITQYYLTARDLAVHLIGVANPPFWKSLLSYYGMEHISSLNHETNKLPFGFYVHDWRRTPPKQWLAAMGHDGMESSLKAKLPKQEMRVLSEGEFTDAVYTALKDYHSDKKLEANPLLSSRLVLNTTASIPTHERVNALKEKMDIALKKIEASPRYENFHRLLYRTFINPVGSQEQAAEFLTLPFSTYRRHLKKSVMLVSDILRREETLSKDA